MKQFVIALGGSVLYPEKIDISFLRRFYFLIKKEIKKGKKFIIVVGGGSLGRTYQKAASAITSVSNEDKDWIGIHVTRLNAHLARSIFRKEANPVVIDSRFKIRNFGKYPLLISTGWKPGNSTDYVALQLAVDFHISEVVELGKPDYVYTANPDTNPSAKPINQMTWREYRDMFPGKWTPGFHSPVDPVAAKLAEKKGIKVLIVGGNNLGNLKNILNGKKFSGTTIE